MKWILFKLFPSILKEGKVYRCKIFLWRKENNLIIFQISNGKYVNGSKRYFTLERNITSGETIEYYTQKYVGYNSMFSLA